MSRYERRVYFERLCELRDRFAARISDDTVWVLRLGELDEFAASIWAATAAETVDPVDGQARPAEEIVDETGSSAERGRRTERRARRD
jgi:hypothetical protein